MLVKNKAINDHEVAYLEVVVTKFYKELQQMSPFEPSLSPENQGLRTVAATKPKKVKVGP